MSATESIIAYVSAPHYRVLVYDEAWQAFKVNATSLWVNPRNWGHSAIVRFRAGPREWLLSCLAQGIRAAFLALVVASTVICYIAFHELGGLFILWCLSPFIWLLWLCFADEVSPLILRIPFMKKALENLPAVPEHPRSPRHETALVVPEHVVPSGTVNDNAYTRYRRDPRQFVMSTFLFGIQIFWVTSCLFCVLAITALVIEGNY